MTVEQSQTLEELAGVARRARAAYDHHLALSIYGRMLELLAAEGDARAMYDVLAQQAVCHRTLGDAEAAAADLDKMERLAHELGDVALQLAVVARRMTLANQSAGAGPQLVAAGEEALARSRELGNAGLEGRLLTVLGEAYHRQSDYPRAMSYQERALAIRTALGDRSGEAWNLA
jgi:tetratricopeptide (TPR) repeat protein